MNFQAAQRATFEKLYDLNAGILQSRAPPALRVALPCQREQESCFVAVDQGTGERVRFSRAR